MSTVLLPKEKETITVKQKRSVPPMFIIGALFFIFGFVTWMNSVLIPYLKIACELNNFESYLVAFAFYISFLVMAIPSAWVLNQTGFKKGMSVGLAVMAVGALVFIPAALTRIYGLFLLGLFLQGTGLAILQTAANPYITILGPRKSAAKRISIMGICNKVAGALAPIVLGAIVLSDTDTFLASIDTMNAVEKAAALDSLAARVIAPYVVMIVTLLVMAVLINASSLPEVDPEKEDSTAATAYAGKKNIFQFPHLLFGAVAIFTYVGVEVMAGDTIISYGASQGIPLSTAKFFTTYTLLSMIAGYLLGILAIPRYISQERALQLSALAGLLFSLIAIFTTGYTSVLFISLLGLANALMWPTIWPLAIADLGKFTKTGSSLLIMGIAGGALIPLIYGWLADSIGPQHGYWIMIPCYLFIGLFAFKGHKLRKPLSR